MDGRLLMLTHGVEIREKGDAPMPRRKPWVSLGGVRPFKESVMPATKACGHHHHNWKRTQDGRQKCVNCGILNQLHVAWKVRFWDYVDKNGPVGCWLWTGALHGDGYGLTADRHGRTRRAHRIAWELCGGRKLRGREEMDHLCRVRDCVNPKHLEPVSHKENIARGKGGFCRQGHKMTEENRKHLGEHSRCLICWNRKLEEQRAARRARGLRKPGRRAKNAKEEA